MKSDTLNLETRPLLYEVFSPPRIVRHLAAIAGSVKGCKNGDLLTGQDFSERKVQHVWVQDIYDRQPFFLMASPPCTHLSALAYSNWTKENGQGYEGSGMQPWARGFHSLALPSYVGNEWVLLYRESPALLALSPRECSQSQFIVSVCCSGLDCLLQRIKS